MIAGLKARTIPGALAANLALSWPAFSPSPRLVPVKVNAEVNTPNAAILVLCCNN
jgi:hypothetical protein